MIFSTMQLHTQPSSLSLKNAGKQLDTHFQTARKTNIIQERRECAKKRESHFLPVEQPLALIVKLNCQPHHFALVRLERLGV